MYPAYREVTMRLEMLAKDLSSGRTGCPSVYIAEDGSAVVQGDEIVDEGTRANLVNLLPGETAVRIKPAVLEAAVRAYLERA
jgi:hypothetical protein